jgi:hypothetical protein
MRWRPPFSAGTGLILALGLGHCLSAQERTLHIPPVVEAGSSVSIATAASASSTLYIVGPGNALKRTVEPGQSVVLSSSETANAGHYAAWLVSDSLSEQAQFDIVAARQVGSLSFLAKPSRLPIDQHDGVSGVVYAFDSFRNLVLAPAAVTFQLSTGAAARTISSQNGVAWVRLDSAPKAGTAEFSATADGVIAKRAIQQVPGDPCSLHMAAKQTGPRIEVETDPVRDCRGNPLPDGTIVSFTESQNGRPTATVDAPLKHDVAKTELPASPGAVVSVALGVTMGNDFRIGGAR